MQDRPEPSPDMTPPPAGGNGRGRFLIVRLSALGDVLHALPAVAALRQARPKARIDWIVEDRFAALLEGNSLIDRVHVVPRARWRNAVRRPWSWPALAVGFARLVGSLWACRYDATVDLQGNAKSGLWSLLSGAPSRFGFRSREVREGNSLLTNRHVRTPAGATHRIERALAVVAAAGGLDALPYTQAPLPTSLSDRAWVDRELARYGLPPRGFVVVHPGTSGFGEFKRWPAEQFGRLARRLTSDGSRVVVTAGPSEGQLGAEVARASGGAAVVLTPPTVRALAELLSRARVFVSADTGPLHVAAAAGVPVVGLFGPKDPRVYGAYLPPTASRSAEPGVTVTSDGVPCRPCELRRCPDPVCMSTIDVEAVLAGVDRALLRT